MQGFKNQTTAGTDGVNIKLFKYAFQKVLICFTDLAKYILEVQMCTERTERCINCSNFEGRQTRFQTKAYIQR